MEELTQLVKAMAFCLQRHRMLTESGVIVQNPDGSREAVSPGEAIERIAAMSPEMRALYEER